MNVASFQHEADLMEFIGEYGIGAQVVLYLLAGMYDGSVVAAAQLVADGGERYAEILAQ
jgi:hypothetical protein